MGPDDALRADRSADGSAAAEPGPPRPEIDQLNWVFFGPNGLRAGWSILLFAVLIYFLFQLFKVILSFVVMDVAHLHVNSGTALNTIFGEANLVAALVSSCLVVAALERRRLTDYNLAVRRPLVLFLGGAVAGFAAVSALIGGLSGGGWLHFGPVALAGPPIFEYALLWGLAFALVGMFEEGVFRCYLFSTLARGLNFWWALAVIAVICGFLISSPHPYGAWGVYIVSLAGLVPCFYLEWKKAAGRGLWQAAWVTSAAFGFVHTHNNGENWMGILAAASIGFVFCVSIRVTGSAWWAIGCHASWDWAESYFYGTADSGFYARGHLFTSIPSGPPLWSGGAAGPEGSVLVFPAIFLLLAVLLLLYKRQMKAVVIDKAPHGTSENGDRQNVPDLGTR